jgi:hypothetical protein
LALVRLDAIGASVARDWRVTVLSACKYNLRLSSVAAREA